MSAAHSDQELTALIFACLEGIAHNEQIQALEQRLQADPVARQIYHECLAIYAGLRQSGANLLAESPETASPGKPDLDNERVREIERYARQQLEAYLRQKNPAQSAPTRPPSREYDLAETLREIAQTVQRWTARGIKFGKISLAAIVILLIGLVIHANIQAHAIVATLQDGVHDQWESQPTGPNLRRGWLSLNQGYARIVFKRGAQALIQAPCRFRLLSPNRMFLENGTVTARVPTEAIGFKIETPSSTFEDFGTEFGVIVNAASNSEIHVFDGEVGVCSSIRNQGQRAHRLTQGHCAVTDLNGGVYIDQSHYGSHQFLRELPDPNQITIPGKYLSLADLVGSGNGFGTGQSGGDLISAIGSINPITGRPDDPSRPLAPWHPNDVPAPKDERYDYYHYRCSNDYIRVPKLPFIDGVFVPNGQEELAEVSSEGHIFRECPPTDGLVKWNITNGWRYRRWNDDRYTNAQLDKASGLSLSANMGITFDLSAIAAAIPGSNIKAFDSQAGIPICQDPNRAELDLWVLIDGEVRFVHQDVHYPKMYPIHVPIQAGDRFLTLVVTDSQTPKPASHFSNMDWCFWEAPILTLETTQTSNP